MTSQYRHRRSSNPATNFTALEPGEIAVNTANRQLSVGDADGASIGVPLSLLAVRIFDTRAIYAAGDYVINTGILYRGKNPTIGPGAFTPANWDVIAGQATGETGTYVQRIGDTMTGQLGLPPGANATQAVRRDYVDSALQSYATLTYVNGLVSPLASTSYVNAELAKVLPKAGGTMTGALTLASDPTADLHASTKAYVDSKVTPTVNTPPGAVMDFAMPAAPAGWLTCDGQAISRSAFAALFAAIGTTWGAGDGATTFNVPNFQTRYRRHRDNDGNYAGGVGNYQNPCNLSHYHGFNVNSGYVSSDHAHYTSGNTGNIDRGLNHTHGGIPNKTTITSGGFVNVDGFNYVSGLKQSDGTNTGNLDHLHAFGAWSGGISANHYHNVAGNTGTGSADGSYEARPYSATVLTCIKT